MKNLLRISRSGKLRKYGNKVSFVIKQFHKDLKRLPMQPVKRELLLKYVCSQTHITFFLEHV